MYIFYGVSIYIANYFSLIIRLDKLKKANQEREKEDAPKIGFGQFIECRLQRPGQIPLAPGAFGNTKLNTIPCFDIPSNMRGELGIDVCTIGKRR